MCELSVNGKGCRPTLPSTPSCFALFHHSLSSLIFRRSLIPPECKGCVRSKGWPPWLRGSSEMFNPGCGQEVDITRAMSFLSCKRTVRKPLMTARWCPLHGSLDVPSAAQPQTHVPSLLKVMCSYTTICFNRIQKSSPTCDAGGRLCGSKLTFVQSCASFAKHQGVSAHGHPR